jgi:hypothetical protein
MKEPTIKDTPLKELAEWGLRAAEEDYFRKTCSACGHEFSGPSHVDDYHCFTPLCDDCYYDDAANYATAWKIKGRGYRNAPETDLDDSGRPIRQ